jgi:hypothetical protein
VTYIPFASASDVVASDDLQLLNPFRVLLRTSELLFSELEFIASEWTINDFSELLSLTSLLLFVVLLNEF